MIETLKVWSSRCDTTLKELEEQVAKIKHDAAKRKKDEGEWDAYVEKLIEKEGKGSWGESDQRGGGWNKWKGGAGKRGNEDSDTAMGSFSTPFYYN